MRRTIGVYTGEAGQAATQAAEDAAANADTAAARAQAAADRVESVEANLVVLVDETALTATLSVGSAVVGSQDTSPEGYDTITLNLL